MIMNALKKRVLSKMPVYGLKMEGRNTMKKIICKVEYDTDAAELVKKKTGGAPGDPAGYEESLYKMADGKLFLYVNGGPESPYPEENIKRMSAAKAEEWKNA